MGYSLPTHAFTFSFIHSLACSLIKHSSCWAQCWMPWPTGSKGDTGPAFISPGKGGSLDSALLTWTNNPNSLIHGQPPSPVPLPSLANQATRLEDPAPMVPPSATPATCHTMRTAPPLDLLHTHLVLSSKSGTVIMHIIPTGF